METWEFITDLLLTHTSSDDPRAEFERIAGVMATVVNMEILREHAMVLMGDGPRVKVYCLYDEEAITGDKARENGISHNPFASGDWTLSVPVPEQDKEWVERALKGAPHVVVRLPDEEAERIKGSDVVEVEIDKEAFLRS